MTYTVECVECVWSEDFETIEEQDEATKCPQCGGPTKKLGPEKLSQAFNM